MGEDDAVAEIGTKSSSENQNDDAANEEEQNLLKFLDSMDDYLILIDSLSSRLRQGWLELASARHSMGASRMNASSFDLKYHSAATTLQLEHQNDQPHFMLRKWESTNSPKRDLCEAKFEEDKLVQSLSNGLRIRTKNTSESSEMKEKRTENTESPLSIDDQAQKERLKSLSMFGALVSPKLRSAQLSFETALETLAEIANARASLLCAYEQVQKERDGTIG